MYYNVTWAIQQKNCTRRRIELKIAKKLNGSYAINPIFAATEQLHMQHSN